MSRIYHLLKRLLRDPMAGFFLAGGSLFLLYGLLTDDPVTRVVVSGDDVHRLISARQAVLGRSLTDQEKRALQESYIDNEVLVREAIGLGLHLEDSRIRKRLAEKMYYLFDRDIPEPTAEQLAQYYADHRDQYLTPPTISFEHHFFNDDKAEADTAFGLLSLGREVEVQGDQFWLGHVLEEYSAEQIVHLFGRDFAESLTSFPVDVWQGPVKSGRGWHLVKVVSRNDPRPLAFEETALRVKRNWLDEQREKYRSEFIERMKNRYAVVVEAADAK